MHYLEPIDETSYLSVPNAPVYRQIMRCFYREYEKMNFQLYKEDVLELLKKEEQFSDYTMEQLVLDLDALVKWKNLTTFRIREGFIQLLIIKINSISIQCQSTRWKLSV